MAAVSATTRLHRRTIGLRRAFQPIAEARGFARGMLVDRGAG